jgi:hypothetical protein
MNDTTMTTGLAQTWVTVTDADGRARLEARWTEPTHHDAPAHATHATHAA